MLTCISWVTGQEVHKYIHYTLWIIINSEVSITCYVPVRDVIAVSSRYPDMDFRQLFPDSLKQLVGLVLCIRRMYKEKQECSFGYHERKNTMSSSSLLFLWSWVPKWYRSNTWFKLWRYEFIKYCCIIRKQKIWYDMIWYPSIL